MTSRSVMESLGDLAVPKIEHRKKKQFAVSLACSSGHGAASCVVAFTTLKLRMS